MTAEKVRCIVCLSIKPGKPLTRSGGKRTLKGWVCSQCAPDPIRKYVDEHLRK